MKIRIGAVDLDGLVPQHRLQTELRLPVEFDEGRFVLGVDEAEGVDAEPLHEAERAGIARSDICHMTMCMLSGVSEMKSQKLSCADCA